MKTSYFLLKNNLKSFFTPGSPMPFHPGLKKLFKLFFSKK